MHELGLTLPAASADAVCDLLADTCGAISVTLEDADAGSADERPVFDEPGLAAAPGWRRAVVSALFTSEPEAIAAAGMVAATHADVHVHSLATVSEQDWVRASQAQFGPVEIEAGFWIVPTWSAIPEGATRTIRLDPGTAFGTGTHPTTRLVLRRMVAEAGRRPWRRVLDYGSGSGILAIAAALLGAVEVDAVDIDPAAVDASAFNARANDVAVATGSPTAAQGHYDLVVANILATPLMVLAPLLAAHVAPGGSLMLAGILERQAAALCDSYAPWLALEVAASDDGWILMAGRRPGDASDEQPGAGHVA